MSNPILHKTPWGEDEVKAGADGDMTFWRTRSCGCHVLGLGPTDGPIKRQRFGWFIFSKVNCFSKNWVVDREYYNGLL